MAPRPQQRPGKQTAPSNGLRAAKIAKQRNKHKVVVEDVGQKSRKVLSFNTEPPPGYTFIPAGNPELTSALKEFAKKGNHQIYAVSATPHASRHELSREVHRIGFHFPTEVVARVCAYYGIRLTSGGKLVEEKDDDKLFMRLKQRGLVPTDAQEHRPEDKPRDQVTINTEAKQIITDLFPNIPDNDLFQIIKTAFQLGDGKVGTADEIPLVRRAQLSVVAHIRHTYTGYDKLLRQVPYSEARHRVENETLKRLIAWRGDDDNKQAVEDTLREVVVISDEEDSDDEVEDGQILDNSDVQVQLVTNRARQATNHGARAHSPIEVTSDDDAPKGYRYLSQVVRRAPLPDQRPAVIARQESRYAVWDRYRQEYRAAIAPQPTRVVERILIEDTNDPRGQPTYSVREPYYDSAPQRTMEPPPTPQIRVVRQASPQPLFRAADGRIYERVVVQAESGNTPTTPRRIYTPPAGYGQHYRSAPGSPRIIQTYTHGRTPSLDESEGPIVPSIEGSNGMYASPISRRNPFDDPETMYRKRQSGDFQTHGRQPLVDLTADANDTLYKRRRVDVTPPSAHGQYHNHLSYQPFAIPNTEGRPHAQRLEQNDGVVDVPSYAGRQQVYRDPILISDGRGSQYTQAMHRDPHVMHSPHALDQTDSRRRVYVQDDHPDRYMIEPIRSEGIQPGVRVIREPMPANESYSRPYQSGTDRRPAQAAPVRYVYPDNYDSTVAGSEVTRQSTAGLPRVGEQRQITDSLREIHNPQPIGGVRPIYRYR